MAKNRVKQRAHLYCGMSKEERLKKEAAQMEAERVSRAQRCREEKLDLVDFCGIKDPTPYLAVKNIIRRERASSTERVNTATRAPSLAGTNA